jgi:hypothetical protein
MDPSNLIPQLVRLPRALPLFRDRGTRLLLCLLLLAGCTDSRRKRVEAPVLQPEEAARKAMEQYDANKDGLLEGAELDNCPALRDSLKEIDRDGDGRLSLDELTRRFESYVEGRIGLNNLPCRVSYRNNPLAGATITFEPESFLGSGFKPASGVTRPDGSVELQIEGESLPGVPCGLYKVRISKLENGREIIPAKYNTATTLGQEVHPGHRLSLHFDLK